jgi:hypothetical protein
MIDPARTCLFVGPGLKKFKLDLFMRIGRKIEAMGGSMIHGDFEAVKKLPDEVIPIVGCSPELRQSIEEWQARCRQWIYWDRGYARRVFATWLPRGSDGGYYRWHVGGYQMQKVRDVPSDRWDALDQPISDWARNPDGHIAVASGSPTYDRFHKIEGWAERTVAELKKYTKRKIFVSDKETKEPLADRIKGAHALVTHGSNAATEAAIMGCPVFTSPDCAAALVGQTDLSKIETPVYPDRTKWAHSLAYCQFSEKELVDGTLWRLME